MESIKLIIKNTKHNKYLKSYFSFSRFGHFAAFRLKAKALISS